MLNSVRQTDPTVVAELIPNLLALGQIRQVLQNLVREQVSIIDLSLILNELADQSMFTKDAFQLTEHVRTALGRRIYQVTNGVLIRAFILSPDAERIIQNSIQFVENSQQLMLDPNQNKALQNNL